MRPTLLLTLYCNKNYILLISFAEKHKGPKNEPFGTPVLPDVYSTMAILSALGEASCSKSLVSSADRPLDSRDSSSKDTAGTPLLENIAGLAAKKMVSVRKLNLDVVSYTMNILRPILQNNSEAWNSGEVGIDKHVFVIEAVLLACLNSYQYHHR